MLRFAADEGFNLDIVRELRRRNPDLDIAGWAPSLHAEGGPPPEEILPGAGPLAAVISGYFAERAGRPVIPTAPRVREVQRKQLRTALPWAARVLGLAPLDGPAALGEASLNPIHKGE